MLGLISVGAGVSVLPHFEQMERIAGLVWRPLTKPKLWVDFAIIWRARPASRVIQEFVTTVERTTAAPDRGDS